MQSVWNQAAGDLIAQDAADRMQVAGIGQLMTKGAQPFLKGALTPEKGAVYKRLQSGAQWFEEDGDQKDQTTDQVGIIGADVRRDQPDAAYEQAIGQHRQDSQQGVHHPLPDPVIGAQQTEAQDHIAICQRK